MTARLRITASVRLGHRVLFRFSDGLRVTEVSDLGRRKGYMSSGRGHHDTDPAYEEHRDSIEVHNASRKYLAPGGQNGLTNATA